MVSKRNGVDLSDAEDLTHENVPYVLTQAGCDPNEDNDCGVVALALTTDLPYDLIHDLARVCLGRKEKEPTSNMWLACMLYPFKMRKVNKKRCRLASLLEKFPKGRYYIQIGGRRNDGSVSCHAMSLIDGKFYDRHLNPPTRWVTGVWKVEGLKAKSWWGWKRYNVRGCPAPG